MEIQGTTFGYREDLAFFLSSEWNLQRGIWVHFPGTVNTWAEICDSHPTCPIDK